MAPPAPAAVLPAVLPRSCPRSCPGSQARDRVVEAHRQRRPRRRRPSTAAATAVTSGTRIPAAAIASTRPSTSAGVPVRNEPPLLQHEQPIRVLGEQLRVVVDQQHRRAARAREPAKEIEHGPAAERIEPGGRAVQHEHARAQHDGRGDREPLLLATRQRARVPGLEHRRARRAPAPPRPARPSPSYGTASDSRPSADLLPDRRLAEQRLRLVEHDPDERRQLAGPASRARRRRRPRSAP